MNSLFLLLLILVTIIHENSVSSESDPELQLCDEQSLDAAVVADDNVGYAFKGNHYWQLSTTSGISPNFIARQISDRWPGLTGPIDAAFTIEDSTYKWCTIFLKGNKWFLYQMEKLLTEGTTDKWPGIKGLPVLSAFEVYNNTKDFPRKDFAVYLIFSGDLFSKYQFHDINAPKLLVTNITYRKGRFLYFMYDPTDNMPGTLMSEMISMNAIISDDKGFVIYGNKEFCITTTDEIPLCEKETDSKYFGCPRNKLPTTTTTTTTTTSTTTSTTTTRPIKTTTRKKTPKKTVWSTEPTTESYINKKTKRRRTTTTTEKINDIPVEIVSDSWQPKEVTDESQENVVPNAGGVEQTEGQTKPEKKSFSKTIIAVIIIGIVFCVIIFAILFFFCKRNKEQNPKSVSNKVSKIDKTKSMSSKSGSESELQDKEQSVDHKTDVNSNSNNKKVSQTSDKTPSAENVTTVPNSSGSAEPSQTSDKKTSIASEADQLIDAIKSEEEI